MCKKTETQLLLESFDAATHNGSVTIYNPKTRGQVVIQIKTQKADAKFAPGKRVIQRLVGPDPKNYRSWVSFGFVFEDGIRVWRKYKGEGKKSEWEVLALLVEKPLQGIAQNGLEYHLEGKCRRCNRTLVNRDSIVSGIGPVCRKKANNTRRMSVTPF